MEGVSEHDDVEGVYLSHHVKIYLPVLSVVLVRISDRAECCQTHNKKNDKEADCEEEEDRDTDNFAQPLLKTNWKHNEADPNHVYEAAC